MLNIALVCKYVAHMLLWVVENKLTHINLLT